MGKGKGVLVIKMPTWVPFDGKAVWPFVFVKKGEDQVTTLTHELIHIEQQKELLIVFAQVWYLLEFVIRIFQFKFKLGMAYKNISFEREAILNQDDISYPFRRDRFAFLQYL